MNEIILKVLLCAGLIFFCGIFTSIASRNILKIFIGLQIALSGAILMLYSLQNPKLCIFCTVFTLFTFIFGFSTLFLILTLYKKFRTLDAQEILKNIREEEQ